MIYYYQRRSKFLVVEMIKRRTQSDATKNYSPHEARAAVVSSSWSGQTLAVIISGQGTNFDVKLCELSLFCRTDGHFIMSVL